MVSKQILNPSGYITELSHLSELNNFESHSTLLTFSTDRYQLNDFNMMSTKISRITTIPKIVIFVDNKLD